MATLVGVGFSKNPDALKAADEVADIARRHIGHNRIDLAFLLTTVQYDPHIVVPRIYKALSQTRIIGTSTSGIIRDNSIEPQGIGLLILYSDEIKFETGYVSHLHLQNLKRAGEDFVRTTTPDFSPQHRKFLLLFFDNMNTQIEGLMSGIQTKTGAAFPMYGGGSCDDFNFTRNYQFFQDKVLTKSVVGAFIGGQPVAGMSCQHGFHPIGKPRVITQQDGHVLKGLDGRPPFQIYKEYFDKSIDSLENNSLGTINTFYPLGIRIGKKSEYLIRAIRKVTPEGYFMFSNDVVPGAECNMMIGSRNAYVIAAEKAAIEAKNQLHGRPAKAVIIMESLMRYKLLGTAWRKQAQALRSVFGETVPVLGFYTDGQVFTYRFFAQRRQTHIQNNSISIIALS